MTALRLRLREAPPERLDLSVLVPQRLSGLSVAEIAALPIGTSRLGVRLGDLFDIAPGDVADIRIDGGSARFDRLGEGLAAGRIAVEGDVGQRAGFGMQDGELAIAGSAGPFAASAAAGGLIRIGGDAAESAGGAVHGAMHGLNGATLIVGGNAGERFGDRMRRGLAIVCGRGGDFAGSRMIAGTIVAGRLGILPGYGMRRGTIITGGHGGLPPSFVASGRHRLAILPMLRTSVARLVPAVAAVVGDEMDRHAGDMATIGKGEVLTPVG